MGDLNKAVNMAINIANDDSHGYSQVNRYGTDYDCSSFLAHCLNEAGFKIAKTSTTRDFKNQLLADNWKIIPIGEVRQAGDIFLNEVNHVIMSISANKVVYASCDEVGGITGAIAGDQTGKEIKIANFYTPTYGWDYHLRYEDYNYTDKSKFSEREICYNDIGNDVAVMQALLVYRGYDVGYCGLDGEFGDDTLNAVIQAMVDFDINESGEVVNSSFLEKLWNGK